MLLKILIGKQVLSVNLLMPHDKDWVMKWRKDCTSHLENWRERNNYHWCSEWICWKDNIRLRMSMAALDTVLEMLKVSVSWSLVWLWTWLCVMYYFGNAVAGLTPFSSGGSNTQIDYIMTKTRDKKHLKDVKVIPCKAVFIQHKLVVCDLSIRIKKEQKKPYPITEQFTK